MRCPYCGRLLQVIDKEVTPSWAKAREEWESDVQVTERAHCDTCKLDFAEKRRLKAYWPIKEMGRWRLPDVG